MLKGLFINSKAKRCSIHESGLMIYECLKLSKLCDFDYVEVDEKDRKIHAGYDLYFFNYHFTTMKWLDEKSLKRDFGFVITVDLEVAPNDPFPLVSPKIFDIYCVIDPTITSDSKKVYPFPRPLEKYKPQQKKLKSEIPVIGSFGLPTANKGFEDIVLAVNKEFDQAIIKFNLPSSNFVPNSKEEALNIINKCKKIAKSGIEIQATYDFMEKQDLIKWCSQNTINCFFYTRDMPGLAATTDQAISSGSPLIVSKNQTFRHITKYLKPYPDMTIKDAIKNTPPIIKKIQEDWSQENFANTFDSMINENIKQIKKTKLKNKKEFTLKLKPQNLNKILKIKRLIKNFILKLIQK